MIPATAPYAIVAYDDRNWALLKRRRSKEKGLFMDPTPIGYYARLEHAAEGLLEHSARHYAKLGAPILEALESARADVRAALEGK